MHKNFKLIINTIIKYLFSTSVLSALVLLQVVYYSFIFSNYIQAQGSKFDDPTKISSMSHVKFPHDSLQDFEPFSPSPLHTNSLGLRAAINGENLNIVLKGVRFKKAGLGCAILEIQNRDDSVFCVGDKVGPVFELAEVFYNKIHLSSPSGTVQIAMSNTW